MKNYTLLLLLSFLFFNCKSVQSQSNNTKPNDVLMEVESYDINDDILVFTMKVTNNSKEDIFILKPRPIKRRGGFAPPSIVPPDFFNVKFVNQTEPCILTEPNDANTKYIKSARDILTVTPESSATFKLKCSDYGWYYCKEEKIDVTINYEFDERLLDKTFFDKHVSSNVKLNEVASEKLHALILKTYRGKFSASSTISK